MDAKIEQLKSIIEQSDNIVFFGGAGVSTESGVPDFRSVDGLYNQKWDYPPETILSHTFFMAKPDEFYRFYREKMLIEDVFQLNLDEEFYLKVYKPKTTLQYNKKLKEQYLGLKDYDMGVCFLIKFKFKNKNYELYSTCKYLSQEFYEDILLKMIAGQYIITKNINYKNRVSIYIIDNISIYKLDYDEDKAKLDEILSYQIDQELDLLTPKNEETG